LQEDGTTLVSFVYFFIAIDSLDYWSLNFSGNIHVEILLFISFENTIRCIVSFERYMISCMLYSGYSLYELWPWNCALVDEETVI